MAKFGKQFNIFVKAPEQHFVSAREIAIKMQRKDVSSLRLPHSFAESMSRIEDSEKSKQILNKQNGNSINTVIAK